jgi:DNA-binding NarL/FixJ family response regulator
LTRRIMSTVTPIIDLVSTRFLERIEPSRTTSETETTAVLVAHSDPVVSAGLAAILTDTKGFCVKGVVHAGGAHTSADSSAQADVVVADYNLGLRLTESDPRSSQRMLILTDRDSQSNIRRALERGVRGYLLSGCSLAELLWAIRVVHNGGVALDPLVAGRIAETMNQPALTRREQDILGQIALGLSNKEIGLRQGVTEGTVKTHVKSILAKLNVVSRTQAALVAQRRGLVEQRDIRAPKVELSA